MASGNSLPPSLCQVRVQRAGEGGREGRVANGEENFNGDCTSDNSHTTSLVGAGWAILEVNDSSDSCVSLRMGEKSSKKIQKLSRRHMCIHVTPQRNQCAQ